MTNYNQERNNANLGLITIAIVIATVFMMFGLFVGLDAGRRERKGDYKRGYHDAKQVYESQDFEYTEEKLLDEEI